MIKIIIIKTKTIKTSIRKMIKTSTKKTKMIKITIIKTMTIKTSIRKMKTITIIMPKTKTIRNKY